MKRNERDRHTGDSGSVGRSVELRLSFVIMVTIRTFERKKGGGGLAATWMDGLLLRDDLVGCMVQSV